MDVKKETFNYTYSAKQQREIAKIREKYLPREENKLDALRRLDKKASRKGTVVSLILGVIGCLVMGVGMGALVLGSLASALIAAIHGPRLRPPRK